eukprot:CAMPEP_0172527498 /NCGR_PEP_ID=MMETSP1067-20121228/2166_1 /TAXON_ID=265564 ORGANISM="Thalassiosira punctigera, Strain Tpunct2005C2" /NCGR_SAMPLE_ID=MMETSP1067 /ASSEMBLY_ACC=CAM_ASM_000444 /LENGTH=1132 /DNA_ID=CAMNT_0013311245 /DNA_START=585 /DNA_END=3983 /DNA_ORIENTATION=-
MERDGSRLRALRDRRVRSNNAADSRAPFGDGLRKRSYNLEFDNAYTADSPLANMSAITEDAGIAEAANGGIDDEGTDDGRNDAGANAADAATYLFLRASSSRDDCPSLDRIYADATYDSYDKDVNVAGGGDAGGVSSTRPSSFGRKKSAVSRVDDMSLFSYKSSKSTRSAKSATSAKSARSNKSVRSTKSARSTKSGQSNETGRSTKSGQSNKSDGSNTSITSQEETWEALICSAGPADAATMEDDDGGVVDAPSSTTKTTPLPTETRWGPSNSRDEDSLDCDARYSAIQTVLKAADSTGSKAEGEGGEDSVVANSLIVKKGLEKTEAIQVQRIVSAQREKVALQEEENQRIIGTMQEQLKLAEHYEMENSTASAEGGGDDAEEAGGEAKEEVDGAEEGGDEAKEGGDEAKTSDGKEYPTLDEVPSSAEIPGIPEVAVTATEDFTPFASNVRSKTTPQTSLSSRRSRRSTSRGRGVASFRSRSMGVSTAPSHADTSISSKPSHASGGGRGGLFGKLKSKRIFGGIKKEQETRLVSHVPAFAMEEGDVDGEKGRQEENVENVENVKNERDEKSKDAIDNDNADEKVSGEQVQPAKGNGDHVDKDGSTKEDARNDDFAGPGPSETPAPAAPTKDESPPASPTKDVTKEAVEEDDASGDGRKGMLHHIKGLPVISTRDVTKVGDIPRVESTKSTRSNRTSTSMKSTKSNNTSGTAGTADVTVDSGGHAEEEKGECVKGDVDMLLDEADDESSIEVIDDGEMARIGYFANSVAVPAVVDGGREEESAPSTKGSVSFFERLFACGAPAAFECNAPIATFQCSAPNGEDENADVDIYMKIMNGDDDEDNAFDEETAASHDGGGYTPIVLYEDDVDVALNIELFEDEGQGVTRIGYFNTNEGANEEEEKRESSSLDRQEQWQQVEEVESNEVSGPSCVIPAKINIENEGNVRNEEGRGTNHVAPVDPEKVTSKIIYKTRVKPGFEVQPPTDGGGDVAVVDTVSAKIEEIACKLERRRERGAATMIARGVKGAPKNKKNRIRMRLLERLKEKKKRDGNKRGKSADGGSDTADNVTLSVASKKSAAASRKSTASSKKSAATSKKSLASSRRERRRRLKAATKATGNDKDQEYNDLNESFEV